MEKPLLTTLTFQLPNHFKSIQLKELQDETYTHSN